MTFALVLGLAQSWRLGSPGIYPSPSLYTLPSAFRMAVKTILGEGGGRLPVSFKSSCCRGGRGDASCHLLGECCLRQLCLSALDVE